MINTKKENLMGTNDALSLSDKEAKAIAFFEAAQLLFLDDRDFSWEDLPYVTEDSFYTIVGIIDEISDRFYEEARKLMGNTDALNELINKAMYG